MNASLGCGPHIPPLHSVYLAPFLPKVNKFDHDCFRNLGLFCGAGGECGFECGWTEFMNFFGHSFINLTSTFKEKKKINQSRTRFSMLKGIRSAATASWHTQLPPMHTQTLCPHSNLASGATRYFSTQLRLLKEIGSSPEKSRPVSRSRDSPSRTQRGPISTGTLRKTVMEEVAIPGKYQMYFKPDKRATRKLVSKLFGRPPVGKNVRKIQWRLLAGIVNPCISLGLGMFIYGSRKETPK